MNNFITDRLKMKNNDENQTKRVGLVREGFWARGTSTTRYPPHTTHIVQSPQLLGKKLTACKREREREMHIHIPRIQDTRTNIVFKRLSVKTATYVGSKHI